MKRSNEYFNIDGDDHEKNSPQGLHSLFGDGHIRSVILSIDARKASGCTVGKTVVRE